MIFRYKKLLLVLGIILSWQNMAKAETAFIQARAEIQPVKEAGTTSGATAFYFSIPFKGEPGLNSLESGTSVSFEHHTGKNGWANSAKERVREKQIAIYLFYVETIEHSQTIKELIFPFHFYL